MMAAMGLQGRNTNFPQHVDPQVSMETFFDITPIGVDLGPDDAVPRNNDDDDFRISAEASSAPWMHVFEQTAPVKPKTEPKILNSSPTMEADIPIGVDLGPDVVDDQSHHDGDSRVRDFEFRPSDFSPWEHVFKGKSEQKSTEKSFKAKTIKVGERDPKAVTAGAKTNATKTQTAPIEAAERKLPGSDRSSIAKKRKRDRKDHEKKGRDQKTTNNPKRKQQEGNASPVVEKSRKEKRTPMERKEPPFVRASKSEDRNRLHSLPVPVPDGGTSNQSMSSSSQHHPAKESEVASDSQSRTAPQNVLCGDQRNRKRKRLDDSHSGNNGINRKKKGGTKKQKETKGGNEQSKPNKEEIDTTVFLRGLPNNVSKKEIRDVLEACGLSRDGVIIQCHPRKWGWWVKFASKEFRDRALEMSGIELLRGVPVTIEPLNVDTVLARKAERKERDEALPQPLLIPTGQQEHEWKIDFHFTGSMKSSITPFQIQRFFYSNAKIEDVIEVYIAPPSRGADMSGYITFGSARSFYKSLKLSGKRLGSGIVMIRGESEWLRHGSNSRSASTAEPCLPFQYIKRVEIKPCTDGERPTNGRSSRNLENEGVVARPDEINTNDELRHGKVTRAQHETKGPRNADQGAQAFKPETTKQGDDPSVSKGQAQSLNGLQPELKPDPLDEAALNGDLTIGLRLRTKSQGSRRNVASVGTRARAMCVDRQKWEMNDNDESIMPNTPPFQALNQAERAETGGSRELGKPKLREVLPHEDKHSRPTAATDVCEKDSGVIIIDSDSEDTSSGKVVHDDHAPTKSSYSANSDPGSQGKLPSQINAQDSDREKPVDHILDEDTATSARQAGVTGVPVQNPVAHEGSSSTSSPQNVDLSLRETKQSHSNDPSTSASKNTKNESAQVCSSEAKISSFLEHVHGFHCQERKRSNSDERSTANDSTTVGPVTKECNPEADDGSEDEVEVIENPWRKAKIGKDVVDDNEVEIIDDPYKKTMNNSTNQTRESAKTKRFRPLQAKKKPVPLRVQPERRYVFHTARPSQESAKRHNWQDTNFNANMTNEDAAREQERLFRESAARVRSRARFHMANDNNQSEVSSVKFTQPVLDVRSRYPDHWKFIDPFARLGLPNNAALHLVKSHYRELVRVYHPDKSGSDRTAPKFQAVAEAYKIIRSG